MKKITYKITVITAVLNQKDNLNNLIKSFQSQSYQNKELIIIDGASTDGTLELIKQSSDVVTKFLSEPDENISDAMNKGIGLASGDFLLFLQSDDMFTSTTSLETVAKLLSDSYDIFSFPIFFKNEDKKTLKQASKVPFKIYFKTTIWHQGALISSKLFKNIGIYDTKLKIAMDYDFFLRAYLSNAKIKKLNTPVLSIMDAGGISSKKDKTSLGERFLEEKKIHYKYSKSPILRRIYDLYWILYPAYRKMIL